MGKLIDSEYLKEDMKRYGWEHIDSTVTEYVDGLDIVEAIPKADYETRLKADMVAMLTEILLEIEECGVEDSHWIVKEKINGLKGETNGVHED